MQANEGAVVQQNEVETQWEVKFSDFCSLNKINEKTTSVHESIVRSFCSAESSSHSLAKKK